MLAYSSICRLVILQFPGKRSSVQLTEPRFNWCVQPLMFRFIFHAATAISGLLLLSLLVTLAVAKSPPPTNVPVHPVQKRYAIEAHPDGLWASISRPNQPKFFTMYIGGNMAGRDATHYYKVTPQGTLILHSDGRAQTDKIDAGTYAGMKWQSGAASPSTLGSANQCQKPERRVLARPRPDPLVFRHGPLPLSLDPHQHPARPLVAG